MDARLSINIDQKLKNEIKIICIDKGITLTEGVVEALELYKKSSIDDNGDIDMRRFFYEHGMTFDDGLIMTLEQYSGRKDKQKEKKVDPVVIFD